MTITETKIDDKVTDKSLHVKGYKLTRQDRNAHGGGVITFVSQALIFKPLLAVQDKYVKLGLEVTVSLCTTRKPAMIFIVIGIYRPPQSKQDWFHIFNQLLDEVKDHGKLITMGDLNADLMRPNLSPGSLLINSLSIANTTIHVIEPTRFTTTR